MTQGHGQMRQIYPETGEAWHYRLEQQEGHFTFELAGEAAEGLNTTITLGIESRQIGEGLCRTESGRTHAFAWAWAGPELHLWLEGALFVFQRAETRRRGNAPANEEPGDILAPMPGAVLEVLVGEGDRVEQNQTLMVMESMKMELVIAAPRSGVVRRVAVQSGQQVDKGMRLVELAPEGDVENDAGRNI